MSEKERILEEMRALEDLMRVGVELDQDKNRSAIRLEAIQTVIQVIEAIDGPDDYLLRQQQQQQQLGIK